MKRILSILMLLFMASISYGAATATRTGGGAGLVVGTEAQQEASGFTVGAGDILVADEVMFMGGINHTQFISIPAAASVTAFKNTLISTTTLTAAATTFTLANAGFTDIITPRNIRASYATSSATGTALTAAYGSLLLTGIDCKGNATIETISISTEPALGVGNVAWRTLTSQKLTTTSIVKSSDDVNLYTIYVRIGSGDKLGIEADLQAAGDLWKAIEAGALAIAGGYTLNLAYDTYTPENVADGTDSFELHYKFIKR